MQAGKRGMGFGSRMNQTSLKEVVVMMWGVDPWRELERMRHDLDSLFSGYGRGPVSASFPLVNVYDGAEELTVAAELPGLSKEQVEITFHDGVLSLAGRREPPKGTEKMALVRSERAVGAFEKTVAIPVKIDADRINASFANGILTVRLPKAEEAKPKQIRIEA
ncbi:MAG: Hsp20 family protein [Chitinivibrionales bacterium]|nr:Hsp20 family protein [Chitinivibrionales bacterium]